MASKKSNNTKEKNGDVMTDDTAWFKLFCKQNRFRFCMSEDNWPIAKSIGKWTEDQFFEGFGEGVIGIYVRRDTKMQYTHLRKRLVQKFGCEVRQDGETEGTFVINAWSAIPVAKHLKIAKGRAKVKNPDWLHRDA